MINEKEASTMSYLQYKRTFWQRMRDWWAEYGSRHPTDDHRTSWPEWVAYSEKQIEHWARQV